MASVGHIRDLPKSKMVSILKTIMNPIIFYLYAEKAMFIKSLKAAAKKAQKFYLASDPDREGRSNLLGI